MKFIEEDYIEPRFFAYYRENYLTREKLSMFFGYSSLAYLSAEYGYILEKLHIF